MSLLKRDEAGDEVKHRKVVSSEALPADQDAAESIVPAVCAFDDPATRLATHAPDQRLLAATTAVRDDASASNSSFAVGVVVTLVQTQVTWANWTEHSTNHNRIERICNLPLVVHVGSGGQHRQRHAPSIGQNVSFHAEFPAVRRVFPCVAPPLGAFAMALSSEAKSHLIPRRLS